MPVPDAPRVIYANNPIDEVICQLRFPAILKFDVELPTDFQERVRDHFPLYRTKATAHFSGLPDQLRDLLAKEIPLGASGTAHEFLSRDENWTLSLTRDFLALTCRHYVRWEEFKRRLEVASSALAGTYAPMFFTRVGLRYRDIIQRSKIGLKDAPWRELLSEWITGPFASVSNEIEQASSELVLRLGDGRGQVRLKHGLVIASVSGEQCYLIDMDLFDEQQTETADAIGRLDFLNRQARNIFRWCIDRRLHDAMGPGAVPGN